MAEIFQCKDRDNVIVICPEDTWQSHIVAEHPEMEGWEAHVKLAIEKPYQIYQDPRHINKRNIYKPFILPKPYHTQYLRVCIEYKKQKFGRLKGYIRSAFPCTGKRKGDILIWEEPL